MIKNFKNDLKTGVLSGICVCVVCTIASVIFSFIISSFNGIGDASVFDEIITLYRNLGVIYVLIFSLSSIINLIIKKKKEKTFSFDIIHIATIIFLVFAGISIAGAFNA